MASSVSAEEEGDAELITDILSGRLSLLGNDESDILFQNLQNIQDDEEADIVFHVRFPPSPEEDGHNNSQDGFARILAHSAILKKDSDYFREMFEHENVSSKSSEAERCSVKNGTTGSDINASESHETLETHALQDEPLQTEGTANEICKKSNLDNDYKPMADDGLNAKTIESSDSSSSRPQSSKRESRARSVRFSSMPTSPVPASEVLSKENISMHKPNPSDSHGSKDAKENNTVHKPDPSVNHVSKDGKEKNSAHKPDPSVSHESNDGKENTLTHKPDHSESHGSKDTKENTSINNSEDGKENASVHNPHPSEIPRTKADDVIQQIQSNVDPFFHEETTKLMVVKKPTWTVPVLTNIMEWMYLGICHVNLVDLAAVYDVADKAVITTLTWCIRRLPLPTYLHLAITNYPTYCQSLLQLCRRADCEELNNLKGFCEAVKAVNGYPKSVTFRTKFLADRSRKFLSEGFFHFDGHPVAVLRTCIPKEILAPEWLEKDESGPLPFVKFEKQCLNNKACHIKPKCHVSEDPAWRIVLFDKNPAESFYAFFNYAVTSSFNSILNKKPQDSTVMQKKLGKGEGFKLQMITRFKVASILQNALSKAIKEGISVREKRGSGPYLKGPNYCTSLVLNGDLDKILMAAKAIPCDMAGRCALKVRAPSKKTFVKLYHAGLTFGVDLTTRSIVFVKPLYVVIKVLEFITNLSSDAYEEPNAERTFLEIVEPIEFF